MPAGAFRTACAEQNIRVGRDFPPYEDEWARISIQDRVDRELRLKRTPVLAFEYDQMMESSARLDKLRLQHMWEIAEEAATYATFNGLRLPTGLGGIYGPTSEAAAWRRASRITTGHASRSVWSPEAVASSTPMRWP